MAVSASLVAGGTLVPAVAMASDDAPSTEVAAISKAALRGTEIGTKVAESATEVDTVGSLVSKTVEMGTDKAVEVIDGAADAAEDASASLKELSGQTADAGKKVAEKVRDSADDLAETATGKVKKVSGAVTTGQIKASKKGEIATKGRKDLFAALREANDLVMLEPGPKLDAFHQLLYDLTWGR